MEKKNFWSRVKANHGSKYHYFIDGRSKALCGWHEKENIPFPDQIFENLEDKNTHHRECKICFEASKQTYRFSELKD